MSYVNAESVGHLMSLCVSYSVYQVESFLLLSSCWHHMWLGVFHTTIITYGLMCLLTHSAGNRPLALTRRLSCKFIRTPLHSSFPAEML